MANTEASLSSSHQPASQVKLREQFVQGLNGTTMEEILYISPLNSLFLFISVSIKFLIFRSVNMELNPDQHKTFAYHAFTFLLEFLTLVVPVTLQMTVLSEFSVAVLFGTICVTALIIISSVSSVNYDVLYWRFPYYRTGFFSQDTTSNEKQICVTYLRSFVFLMTSISILAVDFHVFPRRFAKTEDYGVSLMDMGGGLYVMSNAIVVKGSVASRKFKEALLEALALFSFGFTRCLLLQWLDYQQHVSEYGTHCNFFLTLGFVKVSSIIILKTSRCSPLLCGVVLLFLHQFLLSLSLEEFVMGDLKRDDWITANREGIVSLPGYLSLYLIGISIKDIVFDVNNKSKMPTIKNKFKTMTFLIMICVALFHLLKLLDTMCRVSRRLVNLPYVLWTTLVCFVFLILGLAFELLSICFLPIYPGKKHSVYRILIPEVIQSINKNAFIFFIISNLSTGLINLNVDVLNLGTVQSLAVLLSYLLTNCAVVYICHILNIRVRL